MSQYTPVQIYIVASNNTIELVSYQTTVPLDLLNSTDGTVIITVQNTETENLFDLNAREVYCNYTGDATDWVAIVESLTASEILSYGIELPGYHSGTDTVKSYVKVRNVMTEVGSFSVTMADAYQQSYNESMAMKGHLCDLAIQYTNTDSEVDLSNCVPVVNGVVCYPIYNTTTKTLYAVGGALLHRGMTDYRTPDVLLLDFTDVGGMTVAPISYSDAISDTGYTLSSLEIRTTNFRKWDIKSYVNPTFMLPVISGVLTLPSEVRKRTNRFELSIASIPFRKAFSRMNYLKSITDLTYESDPVLTTLGDSFNLDNRGFPQSFTIVLNQRLFQNTNTKRSQWFNQVYNSTYPFVLLQKANRALLGSHLSKGNSGYYLSINPEEDVKIADFPESDSLFIVRKESDMDLSKVNCDEYVFCQLFA